MKTLKSIQKNQEQLNSLLMEKWGYKNEVLEEQESPEEKSKAKDKKKKAPKAPDSAWISTHPGEKPDADDKKETAKIDDKSVEDQLEEEHNCKAAHPGKPHEQWAGKHR